MNNHTRCVVITPAIAREWLKKGESDMDELRHSPSMKPYQDFLVQTMKGNDAGMQRALDALTALPLDQRYIWRIISALKFAFGDFDSVLIDFDRDTLSDDDWNKVRSQESWLFARPFQLAKTLSIVFGKETAMKMMVDAAKQATED